MAVRKRGKQWVADFYVNDRRIRRAAPSRKLAEAIERQEKAAEFRGELNAIVDRDMCLLDFIKKYQKLVSPTKTESTQTRDGYMFAHIKSHFGDPLLQRITPEQVETYKANRGTEVKHSTVNRELDLLKGLLTQAVTWGYLKVSPAVLLRRYKVNVVEPRFFTLDEGKRLIQAAHGQMKTFLTVALHTGLRKGELFALRWQDINFKRAELRVRKSKGKRFRVIPLNAVATKMLHPHPRHINSNFVFHNADGSCWKDVRGSLKGALERAGLPKIRVHDLRHSFVSNLVMAGVDIRTVKELAGHRDITTTMKYAHLEPGALRVSVAMLERSNDA